MYGSGGSAVAARVADVAPELAFLFQQLMKRLVGFGLLHQQDLVGVLAARSFSRKCAARSRCSYFLSEWLGMALRVDG